MPINAKLFATKREELGLSQRELAERADVKPSFVVDIEAGRSLKPNFEDMIKVSHVLETDPTVFFDNLAGSFKQITA